MTVQRIINATKATRTIEGTPEVTRTINTPQGLVLVRQINATTRVMVLPANVTRTIGLMVVPGDKGDQGDPGPAGVSAWGGIGGSLAAQVDLQAALDGKAAAAHTHATADTTGLQAALDAKQPAGSYASAAHTHAQADVTGLVVALAGKEPTIAAGTAAQYIKGDKTLGTLDKAAIGLGNVDNTSDANKPVSTATQAGLDAKQATLVSGTHIKTVNGNSLVGSGNIVISGGGGGASPIISWAI